jgi:hypothetical protein
VGPLVDVDKALELAERMRATCNNAIVHVLHEAPRLEPVEAAP